MPREEHIMGNVIHRVRERCDSICKKKRSERDINRGGQTGCMADMVINRTSSMMMARGTALRMDDKEFPEDAADERRSDECEVSSWVKHLQVMHLISLSRLILNVEYVEKLTDIRNPLPSEFEGQIKIVCDNGIKARIVNFSPKGMQVLSPWPMDEGEELHFRLVTDLGESENNTFKASAIYCTSVKGAFLCGMRILQKEGRAALNFYSSVHKLMMAYNRRVITAAA
jgi:hypothetical protein